LLGLEKVGLLVAGVKVLLALWLTALFVDNTWLFTGLVLCKDDALCRGDVLWMGGVLCSGGVELWIGLGVLCRGATVLCRGTVGRVLLCISVVGAGLL